MTGDELAAALYTEQGYLITGSRFPAELGSILNKSRFGFGESLPFTVPLKVVGTATYDQWKNQVKTMRRIGIAAGIRSDHVPRPYYYRVEAAD